GRNNMRRLVAISNKISKTILALVALTVALTSLHMAASARIKRLERMPEELVSTVPQPQPLSAEVAAEQQMSKLAAQEPKKSGASVHKRQIVISIPDRKLAVMESGQVLKTYPIAVGTRGTPSPDGDFVIINRAKDPTCRHGDLEIGPGKDNPLGTRWLGLSE